jgi:hypothetical protein
LSLDASAYYIESQEETQIDVAGDFRRATFGPGPHYIKGTMLQIAIPYSGEPVPENVGHKNGHNVGVSSSGASGQTV